ncbi:MAG: hypothetical protein QMD05_08760, partial [Candidatus Brocadiaceae bacterium]|nr:hypothetical protein [Candidatus Brocadiaceae bacterium]
MVEVLVFLEQRDGQLKKSSLEALGAGRQLLEEVGTGSGRLNAILIGNNIKDLAETVRCYGAQKILLADHPALERYNNRLYTYILAQEVQKRGAVIILLSATAMGRDLAPRLAARLGGPLLTECTSLNISDGLLEATRLVYAGRLRAVVGATLAVAPNDGTGARPTPTMPRFQVVTLRPNAFPPAQAVGAGLKPAPAEVEGLDVSTLPTYPVAVLRETIYTKGAGARCNVPLQDVSEARVVV